MNKLIDMLLRQLQSIAPEVGISYGIA